MKTIGTKTEQAYKEFFLCKCPRKRKGVFKECLMTDWQLLINELSDLPIQINQFIKGKKGDRKFCQDIVDKRIADMECKTKQLLVETEDGVAFYKNGRGRAIKNLTFCVLGCQMLKKEHRKPKSKKLSKIKVLLINMLLVYYYLVGEKNISNATIQEFEERILQRIEKRERLTQNIDQTEYINKRILTSTEDLNNQGSQLDISDKDYLENWDELIQEEEETIEPIDFDELPKEVLESLDIFNVEEYFLEGDPEMTETLIDYCPKNEKKDVTCDVLDDIYWLAARKIIHLFIYQNELFKEIDLSAECLAEQTIDVTKLRRLVELFVRKNTSWELSKPEKNKFILCTICHLIRHFKLLGKLDTLDGIRAFFEYKGRIFQLSEKSLQQEQGEVINILQKLEPQVVGKNDETIVAEITQLTQKDKTIPTLYDSDRIEDLKRFLGEVAQTVDYSLVPTEIIQYKDKAKELIKPEEHDENFEWVDVIFQYKDDNIFLPFLAKVVLEKLQHIQEQGKNIKEESPTNTYPVEDKELLEETHQQCIECMKTIAIAECAKNKALVEKTSNKGLEAIQKLWTKDKQLRPCIANQLLKEK